MRQILFYGDSNTYGYDPADYVNQRYPKASRWTSILQENTGAHWKVIAEGMNGRKLADLPYGRGWLEQLLAYLEEDDWFAVMLGTNDLLLTGRPDADAACASMDRFLEFITDRRDASGILVIAPPYAGSCDAGDPLYEKVYRENLKMNEEFERLADAYGTEFVNAGEWHVGMSSDLVHISKAGHRTFAEKMTEVLAGLQAGPETV